MGVRFEAEMWLKIKNTVEIPAMIQKFKKCIRKLKKRIFLLFYYYGCCLI